MNKKTIVLGIVVLVGAGVGIYLYVKKKRAEKYKILDTSIPPIDASGGTGVASGKDTFNPDPYAKKLMVAMKGWGTDEEAVYSTLSVLSPEQRNQIQVHFNKVYGDGSTLEEWFRGDFGGEDLKRVLGYFPGMV